MKSKFEIGDKVKFLNQIGGGIVTKITDDFIFVEDEQGAAKMFNSKME